MGGSVALKEGSAVVVTGDEMPPLVVHRDVHAGTVLATLADALVCELVGPLVGVDADVGWDPVDDNGDGEVTDEELELLGEAREGQRAPASPW